MKKILPYILITLIFVNLLAPFSIGIGDNNNLSIKNTKAEASGIEVTTETSVNDTTIKVWVNVSWESTNILTDESVVVKFMDSNGTKIKTETLKASDGKLVDRKDAKGNAIQTGLVIFDNLTPSTTYQVSTAAFQTGGVLSVTGVPQFSVSGKPNPDPIILTTLAAGQTVPVGGGGQHSNNKSNIPACSVVGIGETDGTIYGCAAQILYYVVFTPTSYLFALAGTFFDYTFAYSVNDESYRTGFVIQGWTIVRDFCNMFFIFVLLYVAFATILNVHGFNTKDTIINVIVIGVLINFSLFAAQIIIDTSNILARVFYNSNTIKITQNGATGWTNATNNTIGLTIGKDGVLPLSEALVNKINPQNLIINATKVGCIPDKAEQADPSSQKDCSDNGIDTSTFILVTLLASAINVIGFIVFLSVGLIFVARVIGLWLAMIFVPFTFFTYMVPSMQSFGMVGWRKWWPETISLAFLAPVFIFFLYLILMFLDKGLSIIEANSKDKTSLTFVVAIIIPFAFIMILLNKAKDIAKKMSGEMGQAITGAATAVGGMALGAGIGGAAFAMRNTIGSVAKYAMNDESRKDALAGKDTKEALGKFKWYNPVSYARVATSVVPTVGKFAAGLAGAGVNKLGLKNVAHDVDHIDHARHEMDSAKQKAGFKDIALGDLSDDQRKKVQDTYIKENKSKIMSELRETIVTKNPITGKDDVVGEEGYKVANRKRISDQMGQDPKNVDINTGDLTDFAKKQVENQLNIEFNAVLKSESDKKVSNKYEEIKEDSQKTVSGISRVLSNAGTGTYDPRNISSVKSDTREGFLTKLSTGLMSSYAGGIRQMLNKSGIEHGTGQGDFLRDLQNTIAGALKNIKVEVPHADTGDGSHHGDDHGHGH